MAKLQLYENRILKLSNVLKYKIEWEKDEEIDFKIVLNKMQNYIKAKGTIQIGPFISLVNSFVDKEGKTDIETFFMLQCKEYIHKVEYPYIMESLVRIPNCMYCRYIGSESKLKFAYDKIQLEAFEKDILLKGNSYTIFVNSNEDDDTIVADVFMERVN